MTRLVLLLALFGTGCSYMFVRSRPPSEVAVRGCPSKAAPVLDIVWAAYDGGGALVALSLTGEGGDGATMALAIAATGIGLAVLHGASAHHGLSQVRACRKLQEKLVTPTPAFGPSGASTGAVPSGQIFSSPSP